MEKPETLQDFNEIELKRFLDKEEALELIEGLTPSLIEQGYINRPGADFHLRLRKQAGEVDAYTVGLKLGGNNITRQEIESPIEPELYEYYKSQFIGDVVQKARYKTGKNQSLDWFVGKHSDLPPLLETELSTWGSGAQIPDTPKLIDKPMFSAEIAQGHLDAVPEGSKRNLDTHAQDLARSISLDVHTFNKSKQKELGNHPLPEIVCVGGPSGSGKTTFVEKLVNKLEWRQCSVAVVEVDDYRTGEMPQINGSERINWDHPSVYDTKKLVEDVRALKSGKAIDKLSYSFSRWETEVTGTIEPADVVIVDGLYSLGDELLELAQHSVLVDANVADCTKRRIMRDHFTGERVVRWGAQESLYYYLAVAWPEYERNVIPQIEKVDLVINN